MIYFRKRSPNMMQIRFPITGAACITAFLIARRKPIQSVVVPGCVMENKPEVCFNVRE